MRLNRSAAAVGLMAGFDDIVPVPVSAALWQRIATEAELDAPAAAEVVPLRSTVRKPARPQRPLFAAAAALVLGLAGGAGIQRWLLSDPAPTTSDITLAQVTLDALPGAQPNSAGTAQVISVQEDRYLQIQARGLAQASGYYEVRLIDPQVEKMVPLGIAVCAESWTRTPSPSPAHKSPLCGWINRAVRVHLTG